MDNIRYPLSGICKEILKVVSKGKDQRDGEFGQYARETHAFFNAAHNFMWKQDYARNKQNGFLRKDGQVHMPTFQLQINKINDAVDLYGPALVHHYPVHDVTVNRYAEIDDETIADPSDEQSLMMLQQLNQMDAEGEMIRENTARVAASFLDWLQVETGKLQQVRLAVTDMVVAGLGLLYHEFYSAGDTYCPRSRFIRWDQYNKDPDAETNEDLEWVSVTWTSPVNRVAAKFGLTIDQLTGNRQSTSARGSAAGRAQRTQGRKGESYDLITYTEWFSKNGAGQRLSGAKMHDEELKAQMESWGDMCYMAVAEGVPFPLNLPTESLYTETPEMVAERVEWPIPFHKDTGTNEDWPVSEFYFKVDPKGKWPVSLFKPLIGPIRFINWTLSFLGDKTANSSVDYLAVLKRIADDLQDQIASQEGPFQILKVDSDVGQKLNELIQYIPKPQFDGALMEMAMTMMEIVNKGSGMTEIMYGTSSRQMRSAKEAEIMGENATIRLDDMAEKCDAWMSLAAKKEWLTAVWLSEPEEIAAAIGPKAGVFFAEHIITAPFNAVERDFYYRIVAGSARKPNKQQRMSSLQQFAQVGMPMMESMFQMGIVEPYNAFVEAWGKAADVEDWEDFTVDSQVLQEAIQRQQQAAQQSEVQPADQESEDRNQQRLRQREEVHAQRMGQSSEKAVMDQLKALQGMVNTQQQSEIQ